MANNRGNLVNRDKYYVNPFHINAVFNIETDEVFETSISHSVEDLAI